MPERLLWRRPPKTREYPATVEPLSGGRNASNGSGACPVACGKKGAGTRGEERDCIDGRLRLASGTLVVVFPNPGLLVQYEVAIAVELATVPTA